MRVLGIDPGTTQAGWAILDLTEHSISEFCIDRIASGSIVPPKSKDYLLRLRHIFGVLTMVMHDIPQDDRPTCLAIENQFAGKNMNTGIKIGKAAGVMIGWGYMWELEPTECTVQQWKKGVIGKGNATKAEVAEVVRERFVLGDDLEQDEYDAIAIAWWHAERSMREGTE